jgi:hypothetical protein
MTAKDVVLLIGTALVIVGGIVAIIFTFGWQ